jgi:hypothetical protein
MSESTVSYPTRWSALTPGMPMRLNRLRFLEADPGAAGTPGAAGDAAAHGAAATPASDTAASAAAADAATAAATAAAGGKSGDNLPEDAAALKVMIADLRKENGADRTNAKTKAAAEARNAVLQEFGKALGFIQTDKAPDAAALMKTAGDAQSEARAAKVELAVYRAAGALQGDPNALLDSRGFLAKLADLDPAAADFQTKVTAAIKAAVTENPKLKAVLATGASSVNHAGGTGELTDIDAQIAAATAAGKPALAIALKRQKASQG